MTEEATAKRIDSLVHARAVQARKRAERKAQLANEDRPATRGSGRDEAREPERESRDGELVVGRNGEVLTRKRKGGADPYHIPPELIPKGWTYQWNAISVVGNTDVVLDQANGMYENGWRPVPAERHPGMFIPRGKIGDIVRGGLR